MPNKNVSEDLDLYSIDSPLTVEQAALLMKGEKFTTKEDYVTKANRKLAGIFGLPWKRGRTLIKPTPAYTRDEMIQIMLDSGLVKTPRSAKLFVSGLITDFKDVEGCRGCGFYLTDDLFATRKAAFRHLIRSGEETRYKPVITRDTGVTY